MFCEIVAGRMPCDRVAEDDCTLAFMDVDSGSDGHLLVVPKQHSSGLLDVPDADLTAVILSARRIARHIA